MTLTIVLSGDDVTENAGVYSLAPVGLTDNTGATKYFVNTSVQPTDTETKLDGAFTVAINNSLSGDTARLAAFAGTYVFTVAAANCLRISESNSAKAQYADSAKAASLTFNYVINADGSITWSNKTYYYSVAPKYTNEQADQDSDHTADALSISLTTNPHSANNNG